MYKYTVSVSGNPVFVTNEESDSLESKLEADFIENGWHGADEGNVSVSKEDISSEWQAVEALNQARKDARSRLDSRGNGPVSREEFNDLLDALGL